MKKYKVYKNDRFIGQFDEERDAIEKARELKSNYTWVEVIDSCDGSRIYYWIY